MKKHRVTKFQTLLSLTVSTLVITLSLFVLTLLSSCKKDRVTDPSYESMDEFYNEHKVEEQEFIINSEDSAGHITGNQGTEIYVTKRLFQYTNRPDEVTFPYKIKLVELYEYDDIIFWQMPTPHADGALNHGGEIRVRAFKDDEELMLKPGLFYSANFSSTATESDMSVFHGTAPNDVFSHWTKASDGSDVVVTNGKYWVNTYQMGWVSPAKNNPGSGKTDIAFSVNGSGGENIDLVLAFKNFHGVITGRNLVIKDAPLGEVATLYCMAKDSKGKFRRYKSEITISAGMNIQLQMEEVDESTLLAELDNL